MKAILKKTLIAASLAVAAIGAQAASAVLDTGTIQMGVFDNGGLGASGVGFNSPVGGDSIIRGCLCEGWGASANGTSGTVYGGSGSGITSALLTTTDASGLDLSAQSVVMLANGLQITQTYSAVSATLFKVQVTLTNTGAATMTDVRYARTLDWDVAPGFFSDNYTTVYGGTPTGPGGKVLHTSTNPFFVPDPLVFNSFQADTNVVNAVGDLGGYFVFGFGDLLAGASTTFDTFIGAESTVAGLLASLGSVGVEAYSYTTGSATGADGAKAPAYGYGFAGLGLPPSLGVPEPGSLALVGLALVGGAATRRRSAKKA